jgi:hypothetical protein
VPTDGAEQEVPAVGAGDGAGDDERHLGFTSPKQLFHYMRSGQSAELTLRRLEKVKRCYPDPELIRYVDEELKSTLKYWANCFRVWNLTFGLTGSTMQESVLWSLKAKLRHRVGQTPED